ncbi:GNAT family N-acetyltransferase [Catenuloplanes atrovinosus]|uniref:GNAT superfamily N-acetyltransferase n=1 Tax=Catenuloplanes atrovinosus TaxID=137266 RepID=A0AAE3YMG8_9ACTN|nr:GNAT family N-acetyltransferase [Catenuloplanes atrovinosus]MDR7275767.1 GNAT superfamily N-acetyltransferase [Catenuloplanes atrovinosus]
MSTVSGGRDELVMAWGRGWARSRGVPALVHVPGGFRVDVDRPGHRVRYVLHTWDRPYLRELGFRVTTPGAWIKVDGSRDALREALPPHWRMFESNYLMSAPLTTGAARVPSPYRMEAGTAEAGVLTATVRDRAGEVAASGRIALAGGFGVVDQVETVPEHRRRGLGAAVIRTLGDRAARRGVRYGVLAATDEGRALYRALGWTVDAELAAAFLPEP